jgi:hypothetical protein
LPIADSQKHLDAWKGGGSAQIRGGRHEEGGQGR